jgi:hypothetical protein
MSTPSTHSPSTHSPSTLSLSTPSTHSLSTRSPFPAPRFPALLAAAGLSLAACSFAAAADGPGFPKRERELGALRSEFKAPPPGYGEVPFWWWTGEKLDTNRLLWQLEELHKAGISGTQINYSHTRSDGWKTETVEPPIFSDAWWDAFVFVARESAKRGMGIGMSGYTLDWPGRDNLFRQLGITADELCGRVLNLRQRDVGGGAVAPQPGDGDAVSVTAFALRDGKPAPGSAVALDPRAATWTLPAGAWRLFTVVAERKPDTLDPLNPESGRRVIERFLNPFLEHTPPEAHKALNYFFQDELRLAGDARLWSAEFAGRFQKMKGYDVRPKLAALFTDLGPETAKVRLDFNDVMVTLTEEHYFKPVFDWHNSRGMIYACDPGSRGQNPLEFGNYFLAMRWYTAPGFDTPGSSADLVKNKVGSSIAHLYERPRVWLEGYHSLGWQASPAVLFDSSNRNFLYGSTLLNLHGLYYTTYGGWWEWAPPCYHFRMPYWSHMPVFLKYFERLSYLLSQGVHVADVALLYPHEPLVADPARGARSRDLAFKLSAELVNGQQTDVDFIDAGSLARAEILPAGKASPQLQKCESARLVVAGEAYRAIVLPGMFALRHASLEKLLAFRAAGGQVAIVGAPPETTDMASAPEIAARVEPLPRFGQDAAEADAAGLPRTYAGRFTGRWVWTRQAAPQAVFKHVWAGPPGDHEAALLCDNSGTAFLNGAKIVASSSYRDPSIATLSLKPGDVLAVTASDGSGEQGNKTAGLFFALAQNGKTVFTAEQFRARPGTADAAWLATPDVSGLAAPDPANVHDAHKTLSIPMETSTAKAIRAALAQPDFNGPPGAKALHRRIGATDIYFIMDLAKPAACTFRARGVPERWDPWTGAQTPITGFTANPDGTTTVNLDADGQPLLVAFCEKGAEAGDRQPGGAPALELPLDGDWGFTLKPTMDNRWGDFRLPAFPGLIGAEARYLHDGPDTWLYGHGPQFREYGPVPPGAEADALERALADPTAQHATPAAQRFCFSWREGVENKPAYQNWHHGLNRKVGDEFFVLGRYDRGLYDVAMPKDAPPETRLYQTSVYAPTACRAVVLATGVQPSAVWIAGQRRAAGDTVELAAGHTPLVVRYDAFGRAAVVLRRADAPPFTQTHPLATRWHDDPAVLPFDFFGGAKPQGVYTFGAPPALESAEVTLRGELLSATVAGQPAAVALLRTLPSGDRLYRMTVAGPQAQAPEPPNAGTSPTVALTVRHAPGFYGGAAFPEPVKLTCGRGSATLGDWARVDALRCYSGGAVYTKTFTLTPEQAAGCVTLDLGSVGVTAGVSVNGREVRVLVCPPWRADLSGFVKTGENAVSVTVYNTLNNHYQTIPTRYRRSVESVPSGLLGPVSLRVGQRKEE